MKIPWDKIWVNIKRAWIIFDTVMTILCGVLVKLLDIMLDAWDIFNIFVYGNKNGKRRR